MTEEKEKESEISDILRKNRVIVQRRMSLEYMKRKKFRAELPIESIECTT